MKVQDGCVSTYDIHESDEVLLHPIFTVELLQVRIHDQDHF
jgi:hypothetical protein